MFIGNGGDSEGGWQGKGERVRLEGRGGQAGSGVLTCSEV